MIEDGLERLLPRPAGPASDSWEWAVVTQLAPLRIKFKGESAEVNATPGLACGPVAVDDLVWVQRSGTRLIVIGPSAGATETARGLVELATNAEVLAGTDTTRAVTPAGLGAWTGTNRPAFQYRLTSNVTASGAASYKDLVMSWQEHTSGHYNPTTGAFTAPVAGLYQFYIYAAATTTTTGPELQLMKNGSILYIYLGIGYSVAYMTFGSTVIAWLDAGDVINPQWMNNNGNTVTLAGSRTRWGGYYIG